MTYERNFGKLLNLTSELMVIYDEYLESLASWAEDQWEWESEIARGK